MNTLELNPIRLAVEPLRQIAMDSAEAAARKQIARVYAELEACGWDAEQYAPYPDSRKIHDRSKWKQAEAKYQFVRSLTDSTGSARRHNDPEIRTSSAERAENHVELCRKAAAHSYDAYVAKLIFKIGACESATLQNNCGVWFDSTLTVSKADGSTERWNTKMILNCSVLGLLFNQFPTRKLK